MTVANGSDGFLTVSGGSNPTFNGSSVTDNRTLSGTANTAGIINGTVMLTTSGEGLTGEQPINVPVNYSVQVFSGSGRWTGNSGGSWGSQRQLGRWQRLRRAGRSGYLRRLHQHRHGHVHGSGSVTAIDLTGVNPSLNALSFSNSSYTLSRRQPDAQRQQRHGDRHGQQRDAVDQHADDACQQRQLCHQWRGLAA